MSLVSSAKRGGEISYYNDQTVNRLQHQCLIYLTENLQVGIMLLKVQGGHADALTHTAGPWGRWDGIGRAQILDHFILPVLPAGSWRA